MPTLRTAADTPTRMPRPVFRGAQGIVEEVWDGTVVELPLSCNEHQEIRGELGIWLLQIIQRAGLGNVRLGVNVSDCADDWLWNFRCPDVTVHLKTTRAKNCDTHYLGGPDFLAEIISPGEDPYAKLDFYAKVETGEDLIVHRDPWALELFALTDGKLAPAGTATIGGPGLITSRLGFTLRLLAGDPRPQIELAHPATGKTWLI